jgi:hypothetical protein
LRKVNVSTKCFQVHRGDAKAGEADRSGPRIDALLEDRIDDVGDSCLEAGNVIYVRQAEGLGANTYDIVEAAEAAMAEGRLSASATVLSYVDAAAGPVSLFLIVVHVNTCAFSFG